MYYYYYFIPSIYLFDLHFSRKVNWEPILIQNDKLPREHYRAEQPLKHKHSSKQQNKTTESDDNSDRMICMK